MHSDDLVSRLNADFLGNALVLDFAEHGKIFQGSTVFIEELTHHLGLYCEVSLTLRIVEEEKVLNRLLPINLKDIIEIVYS